MRTSRWIQGLAATLAASLPVATSARVDVLSAPEVLARHVVQDKDGARLVFGGRSWELVSDPADPAISRLSDGAFHPMDALEVEAAVREITASLPDAQILILPFPRRDVPESCCEGSIVFLSPGIRSVHAEHLHATVTHELGHVLENARCADGSAAWAEYLSLRGLTGARYAKDAAHRDRPREIFAEDFRYLNGGPLAKASGSIENPSLPLPSEIDGLAAWFDRLGGELVRSESESESRVAPNPFRSAVDGVVTVRLQISDAGGPVSDVFDAAGRRVRTLRGAVSADALEFTWDGTDEQGRRVTAGVYFVAPTSGSGAPARVHILR